MKEVIDLQAAMEICSKFLGSSAIAEDKFLVQDFRLFSKKVSQWSLQFIFFIFIFFKIVFGAFCAFIRAGQLKSGQETG